MSIKAGTEGGGTFRRRRPTPSPAQPQKPFRPVENPFPEKKEFRLGQYRVIEEKDDYLVCVGYDPNAKDPLAGITPASPRTIKVAKPPALQRTIWEEGPVDVGGVEYEYEYSDDEVGVRTAKWTDEDSEGEQEEEQRIDIPYVIDDDVGDVILAVEVRKSAAVDGTDFVTTDEDGDEEDEFRLRWMDLNVSGRHWRPSRPATAVLNVGTHAIEPHGTVVITGASLDNGWIVEVKSLEDYAASDLTYALGYGFNARSTAIAVTERGTAIFDSAMPLVASCEDTTISSTDLLVMERGQKYLQKLDSSHSAIFGLYRSLREHSTEVGYRLHVVVPVSQHLFCELTASLSAPSSLIVAPTTANAKLKIHNSASAGTLIDGPTLKVSNRWKDLTLASGKRLYVRLDPHYGEWVIVASECP